MALFIKDMTDIHLTNYIIINSIVVCKSIHSSKDPNNQPANLFNSCDSQFRNAYNTYKYEYKTLATKKRVEILLKFHYYYILIFYFFNSNIMKCLFSFITFRKFHFIFKNPAKASSKIHRI